MTRRPQTRPPTRRDEVSTARPFRIGTRGSPLALRQAEVVLTALRARYPQRAFELVTVKTTGDIDRDSPISSFGQGVFVSELQQRLRAGTFDVAVHSLKDVPTEPVAGLVIGAVMEREDVRDALVSPKGMRLRDLPLGAKVGTGSPRRAVQLRAVRPDLDVRPIRGNVDTRIRKATSGEFDAVVLAVAGLKRLGRERQATEYLPVDVLLPAVGQGALAIEARQDDSETLKLIGALEHSPTRQAVTAERAFLAALGGGCRAPIAAYGEIKGNTLLLRGLVASEDGSQIIKGQASGPARDPASLGRRLADQLLAQGAGVLLQEAKR